MNLEIQNQFEDIDVRLASLRNVLRSGRYRRDIEAVRRLLGSTESEIYAIQGAVANLVLIVHAEVSREG
jgi:hypothetical protein